MLDDLAEVLPAIPDGLLHAATVLLPPTPLFGGEELEPGDLDLPSRLAARPSVQDAVASDYPRRLEAFLPARGPHLSSLMAGAKVVVAS